ncbi:sensor histidine kinase [Luteimonas suaedae]|uniref:sensor histidine kinase n=1 Tax=Luteimonas suaedae TaxID=2605430 RepID=UPI002105A944|nr:HAMP domain-containing sensor histidine kinase [Luteimonas suaedae]
MFATPTRPVYTDRVLRRELHLFALYRILEASLLALMVFSPAGALIGEPHDPLLARAICIAYLPASLALFHWSRRSDTNMSEQALIGALLDIAVATLAVHALPTAGPGVALMLLVNLGAAALFLRLRLGLFTAAVAALAMLAEYVWSYLDESSVRGPLAEVLMFTVSFFAIVTLTDLLGRRLRESQALAERRGLEAESLAGVNELIIRRMRTGVLMVDGTRYIRLANEAALQLFGHADRLEGHALSELSPELAARLDHWLRSGDSDETPLLYGAEQLEIQPRFARLLAGGNTVLVFLDDASLVSRRAESLTLSAMGRFSASLAHEIRNPLAAISYSVQLLEESGDLPDSDRRLVQIIHQQCQRTNGIVESVLGLARRERAITEQFDLVDFVRRFIDEYRQIMPDENGVLRSGGRERPLPGLFDRKHLHQVLTVLVQNAINYGRMPGESARITLSVVERDGRPAIEVSDRGPGVPDAVAPQLGRPFFTTSEHGTGLGLYIARELCRANGASLDYVSVPAGGACFRIVLSGRNPLLSA